MATILEFPDQSVARTGARDLAGQGGASAEIVIFPGVRIERWDEAAGPKEPRCRRASVNRDTLDLLD